MENQTDKHNRPIVVPGRAYLIVCAIDASGQSPAWTFLDELDSKKLRKFVALFEILAAVGRISNKEQFKKVSGDIWEFKRFQHRIGCFRDGRSWVLTHGFVKKQDRWRRPWLRRAERIMQEDLARKASGA